MGPIGRPETSVRNYHHSLRNNPEERILHLLRGGSLMSRMFVTSKTLSNANVEIQHRFKQIT